MDIHLILHYANFHNRACNHFYLYSIVYCGNFTVQYHFSCHKHWRLLYFLRNPWMFTDRKWNFESTSTNYYRSCNNSKAVSPKKNWLPTAKTEEPTDNPSENWSELNLSNALSDLAQCSEHIARRLNILLLLLPNSCVDEKMFANNGTPNVHEPGQPMFASPPTRLSRAHWCFDILCKQHVPQSWGNRRNFVGKPDGSPSAKR